MKSNTEKILPGSALAHIAIAVNSLGESAALYSALGFTLHEPEIIARERVRLQIAERDGTRIELIEAHPSGEGPIAKFIQKRGPGIHHLAFKTLDMAGELARLSALGVKPLPGYPATGAENSQVAFLDPKTTGGVLIELVHSDG